MEVQILFGNSNESVSGIKEKGFFLYRDLLLKRILYEIQESKEDRNHIICNLRGRLTD